MKICYLANSALPSRHANGVHVANMADGLARAGAAVTLLAFRGDRSLLANSGKAEIFDFYGLPPSFTVEWLPNPQLRGRSFVSSLAAGLKVMRLAPDLVIGRHCKACAVTCLRGVPTVFETHKPLSWRSRGDRLCLQQMAKSPHFRGLVTISQPLRDILAEETGLDGSRILVAHDAAPLPPRAQPARLGPLDRLQAGYVGAFYPGRGIELILDIARALPDMDFHLVGDTLGWEGLRPIPGNVVLHGFQSPARAAAMRAGCDVLLAPYQRRTLIKEGWDTTRWMSPLKIFEYMSSAKPILCSDLPVLREVMKDGWNCSLLPPEDVAAWIAALRRLKHDRSYALALGKRAFEDFMLNHSWEARARRIITFATRYR